jgi:DoxX-like family
VSSVAQHPARASNDEFLNVTIWAAQAVVGFAFCFFGLFKLIGPFAELIQEFKWPGDYPPLFTRALGLIDIVGGIGLVLPALTRIQPRLTVLAALCAVLLQVLAIAFHSMRGEFAVLPLNFVLLPLAAYVLWGRRRAVPIAALEGAAARGRFVTITLWAAQVAVAAVFCGAGAFKLTAPIAAVAAALPFAGDFPVWLVRGVGIVDLAGGIGILLPALTRILPRFTPAAAIGCMMVQVLAIALHTSRREFSVLPLNATLLVLAAYVLWGRARLAPIAALDAPAARRRFINVTLWAAQAVVALVFIGAGLFKMSAPIADLAAAMTWPGEFPPAMVRLLGAIDLAGGLGILLPALTRIRPGLTVHAALGCAVLQALAIAFHMSRGEYSVLTLNAVLLPCALYVLWGRARAMRIEPRS